jgi:hypothetical protein
LPFIWFFTLGKVCAHYMLHAKKAPDPGSGSATLPWLNGTPGLPDSWAKSVLNIGSNSRSNSIRYDEKIDYMLCQIAGSRDSALCGIVQSCDSALCRIAGSCDSALCGIARSRFSSSNLIKYLREFKSICKTVLAHESGDPGVQFNKKPRVKNIVRLSL